MVWHPRCQYDGPSVLSCPWNSSTVVRQAGSRRQALSCRPAPPAASAEGLGDARSTSFVREALGSGEGPWRRRGAQLRTLGRLGPQAGLSVSILADGQSSLGQWPELGPCCQIKHIHS